MGEVLPTWADTANRLAVQGTTPGLLLQECLRVVAESPHGVSDAFSDAGDTYQSAVELIGSLLRRGFPRNGGEVQNLVARGHEAVGELLKSPTVAHIIATAIDEACHDDLVTECESRGRFPLGNGEWFLKPEMNLHKRLSERMGAGKVHLGPRVEHRDAMQSDPAQTPHAALFRQPHGVTWSVWQNWTSVSILEESLAGVPEAATVHPVPINGAQLAPIVVGGGLFGLGPSDGRAAWQATLSRLKEAREAGAQVAVVPELVVGPQVDVTLSGHDTPDLVLSGSQHVEVAGMRRNRAVLHLAGEQVIVHDKIQPFGFFPSSNPQHSESIHGGHAVEILRSREWAVVPLICADVNSLPLMQALGELRVNLVLVASMTAGDGYFDSNLNQLTRANQGLAVWANQPLSPTDNVDTSAFYIAGGTKRRLAFRDPKPRMRLADWPAWVK